MRPPITNDGYGFDVVPIGQNKIVEQLAISKEGAGGVFSIPPFGRSPKQSYEGQRGFEA